MNVCPICKSEFVDSKNVEICMRSHRTPVEVKSIYNRNDSGYPFLNPNMKVTFPDSYPSSLEVKMDNGEVIQYLKLSHKLK